MGMEKLINEINVNDYFSLKSVNDNDRGRKKRKLCDDVAAETGAARLERKLSAPECHNFFLKVMYHLPYDERERILETALDARRGIRSPKRYFTYSAKRAMAKLGY